MVSSVLLCDTADEIAMLRKAAVDAPDLIVDVSTDALRALEAAARIRPDVVMCRLSMDGFTGTELLARMRAASPTSRIVVRVRVDDVARLSACFKGGAGGAVAVDDDHDEVLHAVAAAATGAIAVSPRVADSLAASLGDSIASTERLGAELAELRDSISQGTSAKADFLSNISHELRTPVTVAKGIAYVLRNPAVGEDERAEFLGQLQGSLDKLMGIIDEIITISELERGTLDLAFADVDLAPTISRAVATIQGLHPSVTIVASIATVLPTFADEPRLQGVITELLENACRYSPDGVPVEVSARSMSEGIVVSVTDHGEGLHRGVAKRSFEEPFSTGEGVLRKEKAGVGVGLHLARQLVIGHGGTLWTDPLPGGGTRVAFCIPPESARTAVSPAGAA
jgi:two-component system, OmpR family, sensor histidine kinase KdpD